jgi:hypothetical protein
MSHDNMLHSPELRDAIAVSLGRLAGCSSTGWPTAAWTRTLGSPGDLAYALMAPVALARLLWLHDGATSQEIDTARDRAALFIKATFRN